MEPKGLHRRSTTVSLSIKKVREELVLRLRRRAAVHHRSLQGELLSILEEAVGPKRATVSEIRQYLANLDLRTADESTRIIREDRDGR